MQRSLDAVFAAFVPGILLASVLSILSTRTVFAEEPSFDKLVELNAKAIFGGDLRRTKSRFTLTFPGEGHFEKGFDCKGSRRGQIVSDLKKIKNVATRKSLVDGHKKGKPSLVAIQGGTAMSRAAASPRRPTMRAIRSNSPRSSRGIHRV